MAIAGSLIKGATKVVGKAINVAKKKKKDLETKGRRTKKALNKKGKTADIPDIAAGAAASTIQTGKQIAKNPTVKKAVEATKETVSKATRSPAGIAATESLKNIDKATGGFVSGRNIAAVAGVAGALGLGQSLLKSNAKPEQEYTTKRLPDGRFSTTFGGNNANVVFASKQLSEKEINEVRTQLAVLDSIIDSSDPKSRRKEFTETVEMLSKKYGISNITGKNLSVLIPMNN